MDALEILANAATDGDDEGEDGKRKQPHDPKKVTWNVGEEDKAPMRELGDFHLIKAGILDEHGLHAMVDNFFRHYHPALVRDVYWVFVVLLTFFVAYLPNCPYPEMQGATTRPRSQ